MYTQEFDQEIASVGENVSMTFTVTDNATPPAAVDVSAATAVFKISRRRGDPAMLTVTSGAGITLATNTAVVLFNASAVQLNAKQVLGDLFGQLCITKSGQPLYVAEGIITILPVNT